MENKKEAKNKTAKKEVKKFVGKTNKSIDQKILATSAAKMLLIVLGVCLLCGIGFYIEYLLS